MWTLHSQRLVRGVNGGESVDGSANGARALYALCAGRGIAVHIPAWLFSALPVLSINDVVQTSKIAHVDLRSQWLVAVKNKACCVVLVLMSVVTTSCPSLQEQLM